MCVARLVCVARLNSTATHKLLTLVFCLFVCCVGKLVPDDCTSENLLPCTDVNEVIVVDLPPEQQQRYRVSLSYRHNPAGHYPQVSAPPMFTHTPHTQHIPVYTVHSNKC